MFGWTGRLPRGFEPTAEADASWVVIAAPAVRPPVTGRWGVPCSVSGLGPVYVDGDGIYADPRAVACDGPQRVTAGQRRCWDGRGLAQYTEI